MNYIYWYQQKIQYYIHEGYLRAKALAHLCGLLSRADPEAARTRDQSDPINPHVSWQGSLLLRTKIEHISLDSRPFEAAFSGIDRG